MTPNALMVSSTLAGKDVLSRECDERLVELAGAGSTSAFEQLVERYRHPLLAYCRRYVAPERAEDVVQLTFMRAYERMDQFQGESALRAWLYRVAHNSAIDILRDRGNEHSQVSETIDGVERPDQAFEKHERVREAVIAIQALPKNQRDAVLLREFEGRSYDEISVKLGVSKSATRQLIARARNTLRAGVAALIPAPLLNLGSSAPSSSLSCRAAELCATSGTIISQIGVGTLVTGTLAAGTVIAPAAGYQAAQDPPAAHVRQAIVSPLLGVPGAGFTGKAALGAQAPGDADRASAPDPATAPTGPRTLADSRRKWAAPKPGATAPATPAPAEGGTDGKSDLAPTLYGGPTPGSDGAVDTPACTDGSGCQPAGSAPEESPSEAPPEESVPGAGAEQPSEPPPDNVVSEPPPSTDAPRTDTEATAAP